MIKLTAFTAIVIVHLTSLVNGWQTESAPEDILIEVCLVESIHDIDVSARVKGYLESQPVKEGEFVETDTPIAQLDATAAGHELEAAKIRLANAERQAADTTALDYAKATKDLYAQELRINLDLNRKNALPDQELERSRLADRQAELQVQRSESQMEIDQGTVELERQAIAAANELVARHKVLAPRSGQIIKIYRQPGEWVHEGEKIFRLVDLSQVKVEGHVKSDLADPSELVGRSVTVSLKMSQGQTATFRGKIHNIGLEQKPGGLYEVQALVDNENDNNQWLLRPNAVVQMTIKMNQ